MAALGAIADINAGRLFASAHSDLRCGLARRRWVISRRIEVECGSPAILPPASSGANQIRAWPEAEEPIDAAIIRPPFLHGVSRRHRAIVIIARVFQTDQDSDYSSILGIGDSPRNDAALFQSDGHGGAGLEVTIIRLSRALGCVR